MKVAKDGLTRMADTVAEITAGRNLLIFRPEDKIEHIAREMNKHRQGAVGITEDDAAGKLVGLLTERDILRKIFGTDGETQEQFDARNHNLSVYPGTLLAKDVMTINPVCVTGDMRIEDALNKIRSHAFRYMPVLDRQGGNKLIGIVSGRELAWHVHDKLRQTIQTQSGFLSFFIQEPYCNGGAAVETLQ